VSALLTNNSHLAKFMTSIGLRQSIYSHSPNARRARQNLIAIRGEIQRIGSLLQFELTSPQGTHPDEPAIATVGHSDVIDVLARYTLAEKLILEAPVAAEIPALDTLYAAIEAAEARECEAATAAQAARNALEEAEEAARAKLEAKIAADPAVVKARANLAGIRRLGQPLDLDRELAADFH
jgi:hypothetical protein